MFQFGLLGALKSLGCSLRQIRNDKYETRHAEDCSGHCGSFRAVPNGILGNGHIPLIMPICSDDKRPRFKLVEAGQNSRYVAISHVWSDGLGNLRDNSLPRCQLFRLSHLVSRLLVERCSIDLFWLDTICIPPDALNQTESQNLALMLNWGWVYN